MRSLVATHLNDHQLDEFASDPAIEIAPDIAGLYPEFLDDPRVNARFYVVAVSRDDLYFVGVMAPPAPTPAPSIFALPAQPGAPCQCVMSPEDIDAGSGCTDPPTAGGPRK